MYPAKFIFGIFILLCTVSFPVKGDTALESEVKAELTHDGIFQGRLRLKRDLLRLSLITWLDEGVPEYVELCFRGGFFSAGRLNLKGAVREFYSSSALSAGAGVLTEPSGLTVTDSFSRTSRLGGFLITETPAADVPGPDLWAFRTNNGELSAGLIFDSFPLVRMQPFLLETDLVVSVGTSLGDQADEWFSNSPLLPKQTVLNCSGGLRAVINPDGSGRRSMEVRSDALTAAVSLAADMSFPASTASGYSLRGFGCIGSRSLSACGFIEACNEDFLSPSGTRPDQALSWGCRTSLSSGGESNTVIGGEYNFYLNHPGVLLSRVVEQEEEAGLSAVFEYDPFCLSLEGGFCRSYDVKGMASDSAEAELKLYGESEGLRLGTEFKIKADPLESAAEEVMMRMKTLLRIRQQLFAAEFAAEWNGSLSAAVSPADSAGLGMELKATAERFRLAGKVFLEIEYAGDETETPDSGMMVCPGFSLSFESF